MKKIFFFLAIVLASYAVNAQTNTFPLNGNVGVGTVNPIAKFEINSGTGTTPLRAVGPHGYLLIDNVGSGESYYYADKFHQFYVASGAPILTMLNTGNIGIGTTSPEHKLTVVMDAASNGAGVAVKAVNSGGAGSQPGVAFLNSSGNKRMYSCLDVASDTYNVVNAIGIASITVNQAGNVGIGTTTPKESLSVNGNIRSKQIMVEMANWPDYVFRPTYSLLSLNEVKEYVSKNHHLPEIPTELQVAKEGINLGDMNKLLVKKVEELTLYLIQQKEETDKQNIAHQQQINELKALVAKLVK